MKKEKLVSRLMVYMLLLALCGCGRTGEPVKNDAEQLGENGNLKNLTAVCKNGQFVGYEEDIISEFKIRK